MDARPHEEALKEFNPTHKPVGDIFQHHNKFTSKDFTALEEINTSFLMCNNFVNSRQGRNNITARTGDGVRDALDLEMRINKVASALNLPEMLPMKLENNGLLVTALFFTHTHLFYSLHSVISYKAVLCPTSDLTQLAGHLSSLLSLHTHSSLLTHSNLLDTTDAKCKANCFALLVRSMVGLLQEADNNSLIAARKAQLKKREVLYLTTWLLHTTASTLDGLAELRDSSVDTANLASCRAPLAWLARDPFIFYTFLPEDVHLQDHHHLQHFSPPPCSPRPLSPP